MTTLSNVSTNETIGFEISPKEAEYLQYAVSHYCSILEYSLKHNLYLQPTATAVSKNTAVLSPLQRKKLQQRLDVMLEIEKFLDF